MKPVKTEASNFVYTGPTPEIMDLPCELVAERVESGYVKNTYSVWSLTEDEREIIAGGGNIRLGIAGMHPIPPVSLEVVEDESAAARTLSQAYINGRAAAFEDHPENPYFNAMGEIPKGNGRLAGEWSRGVLDVREEEERRREKSMIGAQEDLMAEFEDLHAAIEPDSPASDRLLDIIDRFADSCAPSRKLTVSYTYTRTDEEDVIPAPVEDFPHEEYGA